MSPSFPVKFSRLAALPLLALLLASPAGARECDYPGCTPPRAAYGGYTFHHWGPARGACGVAVWGHDQTRRA